jgi:hypothetical protein
MVRVHVYKKRRTYRHYYFGSVQQSIIFKAAKHQSPGTFWPQSHETIKLDTSYAGDMWINMAEAKPAEIFRSLS